jgi:type IV pilus assembly protein PilF
MHMIFRPLLLLLPLVLAACTTTPGNTPLRSRHQPNDAAVANINLGVEYMRRGDYERALERFERARQADPNYPLVYNTLGVLYQRLGDFNRAEQFFKRALQLDANDSATLNNYGRFLCQRDRIQESEQIFLRAAANPLYESPEIPVTNAGTCALNNRRFEDAEKYFRRALELNPRIPAALLQMARLSYDQERYLPARAYLQRYLEVGRHTPESLWLGIRIEGELGDKDAVSSYALLLRNNFPDSQEAGFLRESGAR